MPAPQKACSLTFRPTASKQDNVKPNMRFMVETAGACKILKQACKIIVISWQPHERDEHESEGLLRFAEEILERCLQSCRALRGYSQSAPTSSLFKAQARAKTVQVPPPPPPLTVPLLAQQPLPNTSTPLSNSAVSHCLLHHRKLVLCQLHSSCSMSESWLWPYHFTSQKAVFYHM